TPWISSKGGPSPSTWQRNAMPFASIILALTISVLRQGGGILGAPRQVHRRARRQLALRADLLVGGNLLAVAQPNDEAARAAEIDDVGEHARDGVLVGGRDGPVGNPDALGPHRHHGAAADREPGIARAQRQGAVQTAIAVRGLAD